MPDSIWNILSGNKDKNRAVSPGVIGYLLFIVVVGIILRIAQFAHEREFWEDEAILANEIIFHSPLGLTGTLNNWLHFPVGFLLIEKAFIAVLGTSEMAFRLFPLLCGILSLVLFVPLARAYATNAETMAVGTQKEDSDRPDYWGIVLIAVICFAANKHLIYYASEVRQFGTEVLVVCIVYLLAGLSRIEFRSSRESFVRIIASTIFASISVWLSLTSIYVLAGVAAVQLWSYYRLDKKKELRWLIIGGFVWGSSFLIHYLLIKAHIGAQDIQENMRQFSINMSPPLPPTSFGELQRLRENMEHYFYAPGGMTFLGLAMFTFLIGVLSLWKKNKELLLMLVLPIAFACVASALDQYPLRGRYILFTVPALCLLLAEGVGLLLRQEKSVQRTAGIILAALLLFQPVIHSAKVIKTVRTGPGGGSHTTKALEYLEGQWMKGDTLYVDASQISTFDYYKNRFDYLGDANVAYGTFRKPHAPHEPVVLPEPGRTATNEVVEKGRLWILSLGFIDSDMLHSALENAGLDPTPLVTFRTVDANTLQQFTWKRSID